jgi:HAD superfamily hydrolase (TIGR01509 family)
MSGGQRTKIRAIIFDIDDTLSDWETSIERALVEAMPGVPSQKRKGLRGRLRGAIADQMFVVRDGIVVNRHYWMFLVDPVPPWRAALPGSPEVAAVVAQRFRSLLKAVPFGDAAPALESLRSHFALGVLSNNPRSEETLAELGLRQYFDGVVSAPETHRKPAPEAFRLACATMSVAPAQAAYVGDSLADDVEGAMLAGLFAVWLDRRGDSHEPPDGARRITSLDQLPGMFA